MNATCTQCQTVFRVDPAKVPADGVRARCSVCSGVFWVRRAPEAGAAPVAAPVQAAAPPAAPPPVRPPPRAEPAPQPPPVAPLPAVPRGPAIARPAVVPPAAPGGPPPSYRPASPPAPAFTAPIARPAAPPPPVPPPAPSPAAVPVPPPVAAPLAVPAAPPAARPKRPTNPFLSQDPEARARRLARALVSDIVVYHPAKRRDGLRDGSLKLLFEEEIRKSWEEYVEQVGKQLAEATTFFTDALNEILADGQPVFP